MTIRKLERVVDRLGARLVVRVDWNAEAADRLLDADHAALVDRVLAELRHAGWEAIPEVTFAYGGERGSIDVFGWHMQSGTVVVAEIKSVVPDIQGTLVPLDRKVRLADRIARERGWRPRSIGCLLVIGDGRTARRRVSEHASTFDARLPDRNVDVRRFIANPAGHQRPLTGLWFLPVRTEASTRRKVVRRR